MQYVRKSAPPPPYSSGNGRPNSPSLPIARTVSTGNTWSRSQASACGAISRSAKSRTTHGIAPARVRVEVHGRDGTRGSTVQSRGSGPALRSRARRRREWLVCERPSRVITARGRRHVRRARRDRRAAASGSGSSRTRPGAASSTSNRRRHRSTTSGSPTSRSCASTTSASSTSCPTSVDRGRTDGRGRSRRAARSSLDRSASTRGSSGGCTRCSRPASATR